MSDQKDSMKGKIQRAGRTVSGGGTRRVVSGKSSGTRRVVSGKSSGTRRVVSGRARPSQRAQARRAKLAQQSMPKPPARRTPPPRVAKTAAAAALTEEARQQLDRLQDKFERLESDAQLSSVYDAIGEIDGQLTQLPFTLENLRERGYVHAGELDDRLEAIDDKWDEVRPRVETALQAQVRRLDTQLDQTEKQFTRLSRPNDAQLKLLDTSVNGLDRQISSARSAVSNLYDELQRDLDKIAYDLQRVEKMLDLLATSHIVMQEAEGPLLTVSAEWQQDGEEGPDGNLFLTDQRLLFEQREEVVTKKRFGIFKAESENVQKLLLDVPVRDIESIVHKEEGGFLGMGKDDILELVFAASAPLSRARFHLKGQESEAWAAMIKRVQTGEIDNDRADEYVDAMELAEETAAAFPTECPTCFAAVPPQPRGVVSCTCEFCGAEIVPQVDEA